MKIKLPTTAQESLDKSKQLKEDYNKRKEEIQIDWLHEQIRKGIVLKFTRTKDDEYLIKFDKFV